MNEVEKQYLELLLKELEKSSEPSALQKAAIAEVKARLKKE